MRDQAKLSRQLCLQAAALEACARKTEKVVQLIKEMQHRLHQKIAAVRGCPGGGEGQQGPRTCAGPCVPVAVRLQQEDAGGAPGGGRQTPDGP